MHSRVDDGDDDDDDDDDDVMFIIITSLQFSYKSGGKRPLSTTYSFFRKVRFAKAPSWTSTSR